MSKIVISGLLICAVLGLFPAALYVFQGFSEGQKITPAGIDQIQAIHPQFRQWPEPSAGIQAVNNPPIFLWPVEDSPGSTYDVRLSRDKDFKMNVYSGEKIPYAIYSPYEILDQGKWFWQYRTNGGEWSSTLDFIITDSAASWELPSKENLKDNIPDRHLRILLKKGDDLQSFRGQMGTTKDAVNIIREADQHLSIPLVSEKLDLEEADDNNRDRLKKLRKDASKVLGNTALSVVESLARAYVLTGEEKYAKRSVEWAMHVSTWDPEGVSSLNDFGDSRSMLSMALAYDTFHDRFSEEDKKRLLAAIRDRASGFYNDWIHEIEAKVLSNHVWQHVFHYFFQTALATYGDIPEAELWVDYLYELFIARAPALGRDDGAWLNGNSYFTMNMDVLLDVPLTIRDLTGFDFISHKTWYQNNPYYLWYSFPPHSSSDGFGDNSKGFVHPSMAYIAYADALGKITGNKLASAYASEAGKGINRDIADDRSLRWVRLKYLTDLSPPEYVSPVDLPRARIFPDAGLVYMNSDLQNTQNNLMVAMRSSPFGSYGHMLADQNTFNMLYGGKPVFFHSGHKISMDDPHRQEWYKHTRSHNGILINGEGQPYSTEAFGWIPQFLDGRYLSYTRGDASQAYHSEQHGGKVDYGLKNFDRHILMLYPDIVVVYDELVSEDPVEWSWLLHSPGDMDMKQDTSGRKAGRFIFTSDDMSGRVDVYGSTDLEWKVTNK
ncbi:MAG TPA: DUF4962 domain-containing protein, partial [Membranihabitans sp.]|nr:DUF4962 domain-containing protein [Membranihabitans sp.]